VDLEDRLVTATPEGVSVEVVLAGYGSRFGAILLDSAIQLAVIYVLALVVLASTVDSSGDGASGDGSLVAAGLVSVIVLVVFFGYFVLFECACGGRTVGKMAAGLRAVRLDGRPIGFLRSLVRTVLRIVDYATVGAFILGTSRNQRLGDLAAGTIVVRERRAATVARPGGVGGPSAWASGALPAGPAPVASAFSVPLDARGWDVTAVRPDQLVLAERFLRARTGYTQAARTALAERLAAELGPCVAGAPAGLAPEHFVEGVVAAKTGAGWAVPPARGWTPR
jgi:uncharacterized RDD family membrane protein YckC